MQKLYIHSAVSISAQGFAQGFAMKLEERKSSGFQALEPDYKSAIPILQLRRMSKITRMAMLCAKQASGEMQSKVDAIIVASGLGNLSDTYKFMELIHAQEAGLLSPTAFTQSSHNSLSGQIAVDFKNHGYNMTHVQGFLSFENALLDAANQLNFGLETILLGAADEHIPLLDQLALENGFPSSQIEQFGEGASFFRIGKKSISGVFVREIALKLSVTDVEEEVLAFLKENSGDVNCHLITFSDRKFSFAKTQENVSHWVGTYMTRTAFAMHLGCSLLDEGRFAQILIVNETPDGSLGMILMGYE